MRQVNQVIAHMDEVTQQNAALVEQASTAFEVLKEQVVSLDEAIGGGRVDGAAGLGIE